MHILMLIHFLGHPCHWSSWSKALRGAHFDARRWTDDMKEAFAARCHVFWPCVQDTVEAGFISSNCSIQKDPDLSTGLMFQAPGAPGPTNLRNGPVFRNWSCNALPRWIEMVGIPTISYNFSVIQEAQGSLSERAQIKEWHCVVADFD